MTLPKPSLALSITGLLVAVFLSGNLYGQSLPSDAVRYPPPPVYQWAFSLNPAGIFEPQPAIGAGIGFRLNENFEIWSETSLLTDKLPWWPGASSHLKGVREILQLKYFFGKSREFFIAGELRYKSFSTNSNDNFYNPAAGNELYALRYHLRTCFWGSALQIGARLRLSKVNPHWWLEITAGVGVKEKTVTLDGVPAGCKIAYPIDLNIDRYKTTAGALLYLPGAIRFIYQFGKKLR